MAYGPITSWQIHGETVETVTDFTVLGSKITTDGDFSHKTKRCLLSLKVENLKEFDHFFLKLKTQQTKITASGPISLVQVSRSVTSDSL